MTKVEYFTLIEAASRPGKYVLAINFDKFPEMRTEGSFNLLPARLLNLSYAQYLRFCRDVVGGEIGGKNTVYPVAYFSKNMTTNMFVRLLNTRMNFVMWEREHPDWKQHQEYLAEKEAAKQLRKEKKNVSNT